MNIMRSTFFKNACASASLVLAVGHTPIALAHVQGGSLGQPAQATDLYTVTCSTPTFRLRTRVKDNTAGLSLVQVQTRKGSATNSTDPSGGNTAYSPVVYNNSGTGAYNVLVDKTTIGMNSYTLEYHCETAAGGHTGTSITTNQNQ